MAFRARWFAAVGVVVLFSSAIAITIRAAAVDPALADQFSAAIRTNDLTRLKTLLDSGADVNVTSQRGITPLMQAAFAGSLDAMTLLLDRGADVNVRNTAGSTALIWAASETPKVRLLIERGADVNTVSNRGRTALFVAAMNVQSAAAVRLLLARKASVNVVDDMKMTMMHAATYGNDTDSIRLLLDAGATPDIADAAGYRPLMNAAFRQNVDAVKLLLARGADVNAVSGIGDMVSRNAQVKNGPLALGRFTALTLAAPTGPLELVRVLLDAGAKLDVLDARGVTPLIAAVATDHGDARIVRALVEAGADLNARTPEHETALDWALKAGETEFAAYLKQRGATASAIARAEIPAAAPASLRPAVERSVALLERSSARFFTDGGCVACHMQNAADMALPIAELKGIRTDPAQAATRRTTNLARYSANTTALLERFDNVPDIVLFSMAAIAATSYPPDQITDAIISGLAAQQQSNGRWPNSGIARPPINDGDVLRTAFAIRALKTFGPPARSAEMNTRIKRAVDWLAAVEPVTADDRNSRALGLKWGGADADMVRRAADAISAHQRPDGGWSQREELSSDAYATGQSLYALSQIGGSRQSDSMRRATDYLLSTQRADGSWYVRSRAIKFQPYFDGGFPYGHDQWISSMATAWATAGLAAMLDERPTAQ